MKKICFTLCVLLSTTFFVSCSSDNKEEKRMEIAGIVENRPSQELLNDLYIGCDGDVEALSRMLGATPSIINRLRDGKTKPTVKFEERIREVATYYTMNDQSFSKLQSAIDPEYGWWDTIKNFPAHHPIIFWGINIIIILLLAYTKWIEFLWPLLIELIIFFIAWLCSLVFSPSAMQDNYVDKINPVIEQTI